MKEYIKNSAGLYGLMIWLNQIKQYGYGYTVENNSINLDVNYNKTIMIGKIKGKGFFIAFDTEFYKWAKLISWEQLCIDLGQKKIYLVSSVINDGEYQISPFTISFNLDMEDKGHIFNKMEQINICKYYYDRDNNSTLVDRYNIIKKLPITFDKPILNLINHEKKIQISSNREIELGELFKEKNGL